LLENIVQQHTTKANRHGRGNCTGRSQHDNKQNRSE
jgi:hypothetical protein